MQRHVTARVLRAPWLWGGPASAQVPEVEAGETGPGAWRSGESCAGRGAALRGGSVRPRAAAVQKVRFEPGHGQDRVDIPAT